jgi:hypothetical protein
VYDEAPKLTERGDIDTPAGAALEEVLLAPHTIERILTSRVIELRGREFNPM